ncbi:MAG: hypothetical protein EAX91_14915 [Candidatus Lokiarchaeota archaeon]|nr:hypothetical protein [Candidatus Lokiarchaeota archaeon]
MNNEEYSDDELEEEIEKALKNNQNKPNVFRIIKNEKNALDRKDKRVKAKINWNKQKNEK